MNNSVENLENLWERLAEAIDRAGRQHEVLFLSKLALLLGNELGDPARVERLIETALQDLN
jgi:hypothetical protein